MAVRKAPPPWAVSAEIDIADVAALRACARGEASPEQARRALDCVVNKIADAYGMGWHPDSDHVASFVAGKRAVGREIVGWVNTQLEDFKKADKKVRQNG